MSRRDHHALQRAVTSAVAGFRRTLASLCSAPQAGRTARFESLESRVLMARVEGIDVSHWQGAINWGQVRATGKEFAFQKATEGATILDSTLSTNMTNGVAAGMLMGAYHFARPDTSTNDAVNEANWFLSKAQQYMVQGYLRPVVDVEDGASMTAASLSQWVNTFCTTIRTVTGVDPIIYCNTNYATNELDSSVTSHDLWIANWSTSYGDPLTTGSPPTGVWGSGNWDFWQYSSTGSVSGIGGNVDLDVYKNDRASLEANFLISDYVVYASNFESGAGGEWSKTWTEQVPNGASGRGEFLGRFSGGNNGWLRNSGASWTTGRPGRGSAVRLDGVNGYVEVPYDETLRFASATTVSAWVKFTATPTNAVIAENVPAAGSGPSGGFMLGVENGKLYFEVRNSSGTTFNNKSASGGTSLSSGVWYHLVGTYANGTITTYVGTGGSTDALDRQSAPGGTMAAGTRMLIGRKKGTTPLYLNADVNDVQVYNRALSLNEVRGLPTGAVTGLRAELKMDENTGVRAFDTSNTQGVKLSLKNLPAHNQITISFDLYVIDSWDGRVNPPYGPDLWTITADGQTLLHTTFANGNISGQSYPGSFPTGNYPIRTGALEVNTLGYTGSGGDTVYRLSFTTAHSASSVIYNLLGSKLQGIDDESWGVDNVRVSVPGKPVLISGDDSVDEGEPYQLTLSAPGSTVTNWTINWGDGTSETVPGTESAVEHVFAKGFMSARVRATALIDGSSYNAAPKDVSILHVPPELTAEANVTIERGAEYMLPLASFTLPGLAARGPITGTIDWGSGAEPATVQFTSAAGASPITGKVGGRHQFNSTGTFNVSVTLNDGLGGSTNIVVPVTVVPSTPVYTVPGAPGTQTAVTFQILNRPFEALYRSELGLYIVDDADATVDGVAATAPNYLSTVMNLDAPDRRIVFPRGTPVGANFTVTLAAGSQIAFYAVQDATSDDWHNQTFPSNFWRNDRFAPHLLNDPTRPNVFLTATAANFDGYGHYRQHPLAGGGTRYLLEDLTNGGDKDFDDVVFDIFAVNSPGQISGQIWYDADQDQTKDAGEDRLSGRTVFIDSNDDGVLQNEEISTVSDGGGSYTLPGLAAGTYIVRVAPHQGWRITVPSTGARSVTMSSGQTITNIDFGSEPNAVADGSIGGTVWNDSNGDQQRQSSDSALLGWRVYLDDDQQGFQGTEENVLTNSQGNYQFSSLPAGTYRVRVVPESGWTRVLPGGDGYDLIVVDGETFTSKDFAYNQAPEQAPQLTATANKSTGDIDLSWVEYNTSESGFIVERAIVQNEHVEEKDFQVIAELAQPNLTTFTDEEVVVGELYVYRVRAFRDDPGGRVYFRYSNESAARLNPDEVKAGEAPLLSASSAVHGVRLEWSDNAVHETAWQVWRRLYDPSQPGAPFSIVQELQGDSTYWTDRDVTPTVRYEYQVRAMTGLTPGPYSNKASAVPLKGAATWYFNNFEGDASKWVEWSNRGQLRAPTDGRGLLGTFGGTRAGTSLTWVLPPHERVGIEFDLYVIGTWDGWAPHGGEQWWVDVNGERKLIQTGFRNSFPENDHPPEGDWGQNYPYWVGQGPVATRTGAVEEWGAAGWGETHYKLRFEFDHNAEVITFNFGHDMAAWNDEAGVEDEVYALDNVRIYEASQSGSLPPAPTGLAAVQISDGDIALDWDASPDPAVLGYNVYWASRADFPIATDPAVKMQFVPAVKDEAGHFEFPAPWYDGLSQYVKVTAVSAVGESEPTNEVSVAYQNPLPPPGQPQNIRVEAIDSHSVRITWDDVPNEAYYNIEIISPDEEGWQTLFSRIPRNSTFFRDTTLSPSEGRTYRVVAVNSALDVNNQYVGATPSAPVVGYTRPGAPQHLVAEGSPTSVTLSWDLAPTLVTHFRVLRATDPTFNAGVTMVLGDAVLNAGTPQYIDIPPDPSRPYFYRVVAVDEHNDSMPTDVVGQATADVTAPAAPQNLTKAESPEAIELRWDEGVDPDLEGYKVARRKLGTADWEPMQALDLVIDRKTPWFSDSTAPLNEDFEYSVFAIDSNFNVSEPALITARRSQDSTAPADPANVTASSFPDAIQLTWSQNEEEDFQGWYVYIGTPYYFQGGSQVYLTYAWAKLNGGELVTRSLGYNDYDAQVGEERVYRVTSVDRYGNESSGVIVKKRRSLNGEPTPPLGLTGDPEGTGQVRLNWQHVTPQQHLGHPGDARAGYRIYQKAGSTWIRFADDLVTGTTYLATGLNTNFDITLGVATVDVDGDESTPAEVTVRPSDGNVAAVPQMLTSVIGQHSIRLRWQNGAGGSAATAGFHVYRSLTGNPPYERLTVSPLSATTLEYEDADLTPGTQYWYQVRAIDDVGEPSPPASKSETTSAVPDEAPRIGITSPGLGVGGEAVVIDGDFTVTGYVDDWNNDLASWKLRLVPLTGSGGADIASGTAEVGQKRVGDAATSGTLGTLRPGQFPNGLYKLILSAVDDNPLSPVDAEVLVHVKTEYKLGNFSLPVTDLSIDVPGGAPLEVTRVYDTLNADESSEFGFGWRLDVTRTNLKTTARDRADSEYTQNGIPAFRASSRESELIYITLPGGGQHVFKFLPYLVGNTYNPALAVDPYSFAYTGATYRPGFVAVDGSGAKLVDPDADEFDLRRRVDSGEFFDINTNDGYNPARGSRSYQLIEPDGTTYDISASSGLVTKQTDLSGNVINYDASFTSNGLELKFGKTGNRIDWVAAWNEPGDVSENQKIYYHYNANGELEWVEDQRLGEGTQLARYAYAGPKPHFLAQIRDQRNVAVINVEYDATTARVSRVLDVYGRDADIGSTRFTGSGTTQTVQNPGSTSTDAELIYDDHGNVVREIQAVKDGATVQKYLVTVRKYNYSSAWNVQDALSGGTLFNTLYGIEEYKTREIAGPDTAGERYQWDPLPADLLSTQSFYIDDPASPNFKQLSSIAQRGPDGNFIRTSFDRYKNGRPQRVMTDDGRKTTVSWNVYDDKGNVTLSISQDGTGTKYEYDYTGDFGAKGLLMAAFKIFINIANPISFDPISNPPPIEELYQEVANSYYDVTSSGGAFKAKLKSTTDAAGKTTFFHYDGQGRVIRTYYRFDAGGTRDRWVVSYTNYDPAGRTLETGRRVYDNSAHSADVNLGLTPLLDVAETKTFYDVNGRVDYTVDQYDRRTTNYYNAVGNLVRVLYPDKTETRTAYDDLGRAVWTSNRFYTGLTYQSDNSQLNLSTFKAVATHTLYDSSGRVIGTERFKDVLVEVNPDPVAGGLFRSTSPAPATNLKISATTNVLDAQGRVTSATTTSLTDNSSLTVETEYYADGRVRRTRPSTTPETPWTQYQYDLIDPATDEWYDQVTDARGGVTKTYRDELRRTIRTVDANGNSLKRFFWTARDGQVDHPSHPVPALAGWVRQEVTVNQHGDATSHLYDQAGRLCYVVLPDPDDGGPLTTTVWQYTYDEHGNQTQIIDPRNGVVDATSNPNHLAVVTSFDYDEFGRRTERTLPEGQFETWKYDDFGRMIQHVDFTGETTRYEYIDDALHPHFGQLEEELRWRATDNPDAAPAFEKTVYVYDDLGRQQSVTEYANGNLSNAARSSTFTYDPVTGGVTKLVSDEGTVHYRYDAGSGRLKVLWTGASDDPNSTTAGAVVTRTDYGYDAQGRLSTVTNMRLLSGVWTGDTPTSYEYDAVGNLDLVTEPNGLVTDYVYDKGNRLTNLIVSKGANTIFEQKFDSTAVGDESLRLEKDGQRGGVVEKRYDSSGSLFSTTRIDYTYDRWGRLTAEGLDYDAASVSGNENTDDYTTSFAFDTIGNRKSKSLNWTDPAEQDETISYSYDRNDRALAEDSNLNANDVTYGYGADDRLAIVTKTWTGGSGRVDSFTWDLRERMTGATVAGVSNSYVYDSDGIRVREINGANTIKYVMVTQNPTGYVQTIEQWTNANSSPDVSYVWGHDLISQSRSGTTSYYFRDGLGSTRGLTNASGDITDTYDYDAYGQVVRRTGTTANVYEFAGEHVDAALKQSYNRARWYNLDGRFTSFDKYEGGSSDPLSLHKYLYGSGNPVSVTDPSGRFGITEFLVTSGISAVLGAIIAPVVGPVLGRIGGMFVPKGVFDFLATVVDYLPPIRLGAGISVNTPWFFGVTGGIEALLSLRNFGNVATYVYAGASFNTSAGAGPNNGHGYIGVLLNARTSSAYEDHWRLNISLPFARWPRRIQSMLTDRLAQQAYWASRMLSDQNILRDLTPEMEEAILRVGLNALNGLQDWRARAFSLSFSITDLLGRPIGAAISQNFLSRPQPFSMTYTQYFQVFPSFPVSI